MTDLSELIERVRNATGPDRELDRIMAVLLCEAWDYGADWDFRDAHGNRQSKPVAFPYTSSLDAITALIEKRLPDACIGVSQNVHHKYWFGWISRLNHAGTAPVQIGDGTHPTSAPLALTLAFLLALSESSHE